MRGELLLLPVLQCLAELGRSIESYQFFTMAKLRGGTTMLSDERESEASPGSPSPKPGSEPRTSPSISALWDIRPSELSSLVAILLT